MKDQGNSPRGSGCIERHVLIEKLCQRYWTCLGPSKNQSWAALLPCYKYGTRPETGNNCGQPKKSKHVLCPVIPTRTPESSLNDSKKSMEEIADKYERSGNCTEGTRLSGISRQKIILRFDLIWSLRENMFDTDFLLMYMPSGHKAIASPPGSRQEKNLTCCREPCSTSGFVTRQLFKRYYSESSWSYLVMFKFAPQVCKKGNLFDLFRPFADSAYDVLCLAGTKPYRYHLSSTLFQNSKSSHKFLESFFALNRGMAGIIFYYSEGCWRGYPLKGSLILSPPRRADTGNVFKKI